MKALIVAAAAAAGGLVAFQYRDRLTAAARHRMIEGMEHMMASLPEGAPPKLIMSLLPKLQAQNEEIITMLRNQNDILQEQRRAAAAGAGT
jgi:hypothetical protein